MSQPEDTTRTDPASAPPLHGYRVIDVTRALAGPYCTMLLGDQGADVIKIEKPGTGDESRHASNPQVGGENTSFLSVNRNKRSVELDLRSPEALPVMDRLIADADVFVENFRPGKAEELGLGWERLQKLNPRLVYCSISGWGSDGPYRTRAGYASTAEALGGLMSVTGEPGRPPVKIGVSIIDNLCGLFAKDAITAALLARERTGAGQKVETSLLESTVAILSMSAYAYLMGGVIPGRWGGEHEWHVPWKNFATADGYFTVACSSEPQWRKFCAAVGVPELVSDARFENMRQRNRNRRELYSILDRIFAARTTSEWMKAFDSAGAAGAPVNTIDQVFADPQVLHRDMLLSADHTSLGSIPQVGHAQKFSATPLDIRLPPPLLGEHTAEVLQSLMSYEPE